MSLKNRLWLLGAVSILGVALLAASSIWHAHHSRQIVNAYADRDVALNRAAITIYAQGLQMGQALRNILLDPTNTKAYDNFKAASEKFTAEQAQLANLMPKDEAERMSAKAAKLQPIQRTVLDQVKAGQLAEAQQTLVKQETPAWRELRNDLLELMKRTEENAAAGRTSLLDNLETAKNQALVVSVVSLLLVAGIIAQTANVIFRQIGGEPAYAAAVLKRIADGDLGERFDGNGGDPHSILASLRNMQTRVRELIAGTVSNADNVVAESQTMRGDAASLAQTAREQSSATSAIAAAVEELTVSINVMSDNADGAKRMSTDSERKAHDCLGTVSAATTQIQQVADFMEGAAGTMEALAQKVASIDGIVQTIREIADQTNLLALNAAIEAARAGEQGRGFAVVADEVRKLAERTTVSTQEISGIVSGVRETTGNAMDAMTQAKRMAGEGVAQTGAVRAVVTELDQVASEVSQVIDEIANALREQSAASTDISQRVELIVQGVEQVNQASEAADRRSAALVDLAQSLKSGVGQFRL